MQERRKENQNSIIYTMLNIRMCIKKYVLYAIFISLLLEIKSLKHYRELV